MASQPDPEIESEQAESRAPGVPVQRTTATAANVYNSQYRKILNPKNIPWIFLIVFYLILIIITWRLQERERLKFLKY